MTIQTKFLIGNAFEAGQEAAEQILNPRTGEMIVSLPEAALALVEAAVKSE